MLKIKIWDGGGFDKMKFWFGIENEDVDGKEKMEICILILMMAVILKMKKI